MAVHRAQQTMSLIRRRQGDRVVIAQPAPTARLRRMEALMAGLMCARCGQLLRRDDASCRTCGTPAPHYQTTAPQPGGAPNGHHGAAPSYAGADAPFFRHEPARPPGRLNNSTRYLCAAAYLDHNFAKRVIGELLLNRRARSFS